jgi:hypothetical protein
MSHFTEMEVQFSQKNEAELIAALEQQFGKGSVELHPEGGEMFGYEGKNRSLVGSKSPDFAPPCHLIVRRKHLGTAANDIGYRRMPNGGYLAYISDYDRNQTFSEKKQAGVTQEYTLLVSEKALRAKNYGSIHRTILDNGSIRLEGTKLQG